MMRVAENANRCVSRSGNCYVQARNRGTVACYGSKFQTSVVNMNMKRIAANIPSPCSLSPSLSTPASVSTTRFFLFFLRLLRFFLAGDDESSALSGGGPCKFNKEMLDLLTSGDRVRLFVFERFVGVNSSWSASFPTRCSIR